jgi:hypothetical protein
MHGCVPVILVDVMGRPSFDSLVKPKIISLTAVSTVYPSAWLLATSDYCMNLKLVIGHSFALSKLSLMHQV